MMEYEKNYCILDIDFFQFDSVKESVIKDYKKILLSLSAKMRLKLK